MVSKECDMVVCFIILINLKKKNNNSKLKLRSDYGTQIIFISNFLYQKVKQREIRRF